MTQDARGRDVAAPARGAPAADPWAERDLGATACAEALHPEQPESGFLWVLSGGVTVARDGAIREVRPGTVVTYRRGPRLTWSAREGTRVRWSARSVRLEAGDVASWTADLALDLPAQPETAAARARPRRRAAAAVAIALLWSVALLVAWCYDRAHARHTLAPYAPTGAPRLSDAEAAARATAVRAAFEAHGFDVNVPLMHAPRSALVEIVERPMSDPELDGLVASLRPAAADALDAAPGLSRVQVTVRRATVGDEKTPLPWANVVFPSGGEARATRYDRALRPSPEAPEAAAAR
jgi:hypothetical protein